ncbi:MAG: glycerol-3-phosphate dehydrogenase/oxidase [Cellvibrionaceae bacterium]
MIEPQEPKSSAEVDRLPDSDRNQLWSALVANANKPEQQQDSSWDLIVIGGGITGAGILREAARRGLKVLLLEQQDFAWGTSSRSSKMVHGGLRYLGQGDYKLTQHSLRERERLLSEVPGLVDRMGYFFTLRKDKSPPPWAVKILLWLYDRLAGIRDHRRIDLSALEQEFPGIDRQQLKDCFYYTDAVTDDARLVLRVLHEAVADGGKAINYIKVDNLLTDAAGVITGVAVTNQQPSESETLQSSLKLQSKLVINATGAWADKLRNQVNPEKRIRPLRGSHLVVPQSRLSVSQAVTLMHPGDYRAMFVFPWEGRTVIGTTDIDHGEGLDSEASISVEEVRYLLDAANDLFPAAKLNSGDVISSWSGVRPVIGSEKSKDPSKERRDHAVWRDGNLITVSGGKLTTFRLIALDVLKTAADIIPIDTADDSLAIFSPVTVTASQLPLCETAQAHSLIARYGDGVKSFVGDVCADELKPIADTQYSLAECRWLLRRENVVHLDDLLLRRTRLGQLLDAGAEQLFDSLSAIFQQELKWTDGRWQAEVERYRELWKRHYYLPTELTNKDNAADRVDEMSV